MHTVLPTSQRTGCQIAAMTSDHQSVRKRLHCRQLTIFLDVMWITTPPQHLVVFITSDQNFAATISQLQTRHFRVEVIYHGPSQQHSSIKNTAHGSHDWLPFLGIQLHMPLSLASDDDSNNKTAPDGPVFNEPAVSEQTVHATDAPTGPADASEGTSLLLLSRWKCTDSRSIKAQCRLLLAAYLSQEAADTAIVDAGTSTALVDFGSLPNASQQLQKQL